MIIADRVSWGDGDLAPKLLGTYEEELHPYLHRSSKRSYDAVINIGCAEGYYAVGCSLLFPGLPVLAIDNNPAAIDILKENMRLNDVDETRIRVEMECDERVLVDTVSTYKRSLIICDIEGYETKLFASSTTMDALRHSDLIIEIHDFVTEGTTGLICSSFCQTHRLEIIYSGGRNPNVFPFLSHLTDIERWLAICENRPRLMNWVICDALERRPITDR
jgi:hypothetical protein